MNLKQLMKQIFKMDNFYKNGKKYKQIILFTQKYEFEINIEKILSKYKQPKYATNLEMQNSRPSFSVIMAAYNRAHCISTAIDSFLNQTYTNAELIIIDDGSTDNTEALIKNKYSNELSNGKIKYYKQNNFGQTIARNNAYKYCKNDYICFLDTDNIMRPYYLETFAKCICANPETNFFFGAIKFINSHKPIIIGKPFNLQEIIDANFIDLNVVCLKKTFIDEQKILFDENLKSLEDYDLVLRYAKITNPIFIPLVLVDYYAIEKQRVSDKITLQQDYLYIFKKHNIFSNITISTIITTYNHEKYIEQAIKSALSQIGNFNHEIIISDDGSTDNTHKIIQEYAQKYPGIIKDISSKTNLGISENMKKCLNYATGDYICVLEGDDFWSSRVKLLKQLKFLEQNKDCSFCYAQVEAFNQDTEEKFLFKRHQNKKYIKAKGKDLFYKKQILNRCVTFSACMYRAELLKNLPDILFTDRFSEVALMFYLENFGKVGFCNICATQYRIHSNGVWSGMSRLQQLESGLITTKTSKAVARKNLHKKFDNVIEYETSLINNYKN